MEHKQDNVTFQEADRRYAELKRQQERGEITLEDFDAKLQDTMVQDGDGRWWAKSRSSGEWHYHDGAEFVKGTPPGYQLDHTTAKAPSEENNTKAEQQTQPPDEAVARPSLPMLVRSWWALALGGSMLAIFGVLSTSDASYILLYSALIANGVFIIIASRTADRRLWLLPQGIVSVLGGLLAILTLATGLNSAFSYTFMFWTFSLGIVQVIGAYRLMRESGAMRLMMISGASLAVYGVYVFTAIRGILPWSPLLGSIWLLAAGILFVVFAFRVRHRNESAAGG